MTVLLYFLADALLKCSFIFTGIVLLYKAFISEDITVSNIAQFPSEVEHTTIKYM